MKKCVCIVELGFIRMTDIEFKRSKGTIVQPNAEPKQGYSMLLPDGVNTWVNEKEFKKDHLPILTSEETGKVDVAATAGQLVGPVSVVATIRLANGKNIEKVVASDSHEVRSEVAEKYADHLMYILDVAKNGFVSTDDKPLGL